MNMRKILNGVLACTMALSMTSVANASTSGGEADTQPPSYTIDTPYEFPIVPEMDEWKLFNTTGEMYEATQIPDEILEEMSTFALLETLMEHPMYSDILAFDDQTIGFDIVSNKINIFDELEERADLDEALRQVSTDFTNTVSTFGVETDEILDAQIDAILLNVFIDSLNNDIDDNDPKIQSFSIPSYVYTPKGSSVFVYLDRDWSYYSITEATAVKLNNEMIGKYPNAVYVPYSLTPAFNCHSYAWYSTNLNNNRWMPYPGAFITDGSYSQASIYLATKVVYNMGGEPIHSALITAM
ncbi:MAG: hypothetical protein R3Y63_15825 [Eubacteriales bacterium]